eukprot:TRINITY_DN12835_c0_g1_i1.p1 TRINITY_DN12835_c0_g1~~TRINITY_DN12835_c0_g1_i1.p1  ORF type:complete len:620 (+),score=75.84 TRINITY_DN12835_c0_g1_i1:168-2027(+)
MVRLTVACGLAGWVATEVAGAIEKEAWEEEEQESAPGVCGAGDETCAAKVMLLQKQQRRHSSTNRLALDGDQDKETKKPRVSLADSAANEKLRAKLTIESHLGKLAARHYRAYREEETCFENARKAFDLFVSSSQLAQELTSHEYQAFRKRFLAELDYDCKHDPHMKHDWVTNIAEAMQEEKPAFTEALADSLRNARLAYNVKMQPWMVHEPQKSLEQRCGKKSGDKAEDVLMAQTEAFLSKTSVNASKIPHNFDSRDHWPDCAEIIGRIFNQGICGSCWAFGGLSAVDSRLCIATQGAYQGQLSRGYAASCATENGCDSGMSAYVYTLLSTTGIPTGGDAGCNPYFGTGEGIDHFELTQAAPPCPAKCQEKYPRAMHQDKFVVPGFSEYREIWPTNRHGNQVAKKSMIEAGPLTFGIYVNNAFWGYSRGIFDSGCGEWPNHEVVAIGWRADHWIGLNSWGEGWGERGAFRVADCVITDWTIPGDVTGMDNFPLPLPVSYHRPPKHWGTHRKWRVTGSCSVDSEDCVSSGNYPRDYGSNERCVIHHARAFGVINVLAFNTEASKDQMIVNGEAYSGTHSPSMVLPTADIVWESDGSVQAMGWRICPDSSGQDDYYYYKQ